MSSTQSTRLQYATLYATLAQGRRDAATLKASLFDRGQNCHEITPYAEQSEAMLISQPRGGVESCSTGGAIVQIRSRKVGRTHTVKTPPRHPRRPRRALRQITAIISENKIVEHVVGKQG